MIANKTLQRLRTWILFMTKAGIASAIFCHVAIISPASAQTTEVGKALMSLGDVKLNRAGQLTPLKKGGAVLAGDVIVTGAASNAQVRMTDGAIIAIRPESEFKINEYSYNGKADGTEKASLSLVKGGVRAVTGVIGRENRDNLKVDAVVATIGVRGTGFNIVYCQGGCVNSDRSTAKNGLYANVFEGKVMVANEAKNGVYGQNEPIYVENKTSSIERLKEIPVFLKDALAGQVAVPKKAESLVVPVMAPVTLPTESASTVPSATSSVAMVSGVVVTVPPAITADPSTFIPSVYYNKPGMGEGSTIAASTTGGYYLQLSEIFPNSVGSGDGLPYHNVSAVNNAKTGTTYFNPGYWGATTSGTTTADSVTSLTLYSTTSGGSIATVASLSANGTITGSVNDIYQMGANASQVEGGTYNGIVSWGRWGGTVQQVAGYNQGQPIAYDAQSGFSYVVGTLTSTAQLDTMLTSTKPTYSFALIGATSPSSVTPVTGTSWYVTSGNLTANFASRAISGNLAMTTNQSAGYGFYNMTFSGGLGSGATNAMSTALTKTAGTLTTCATTCTGTGNASFYGTNAAAAGLAYDVNTGSNVIQGVAVFKR
jgi:FecR protein